MPGDLSQYLLQQQQDQAPPIDWQQLLYGSPSAPGAPAGGYHAYNPQETGDLAGLQQANTQQATDLASQQNLNTHLANATTAAKLKAIEDFRTQNQYPQPQEMQSQGPYPRAQFPMVPQRPAPQADQSARSLAGLAAGLAPGFMAGDIAASPLEGAMQHANQVYQDKLKTYGLTLQQLQQQHEDDLNARNEEAHRQQFNLTNKYSGQVGSYKANRDLMEMALPLSPVDKPEEQAQAAANTKTLLSGANVKNKQEALDTGYKTSQTEARIAIAQAQHEADMYKAMYVQGQITGRADAGNKSREQRVNDQIDAAMDRVKARAENREDLQKAMFEFRLALAQITAGNAQSRQDDIADRQDRRFRNQNLQKDLTDTRLRVESAERAVTNFKNRHPWTERQNDTGMQSELRQLYENHQDAVSSHNSARASLGLPQMEIRTPGVSSLPKMQSQPPPVNTRGATPKGTATPLLKGGGSLIKVGNIADAMKLPKGTHFLDPTGVERVRP